MDLERFLWIFEGNPDVIGADDARGPDAPGPLPLSGEEDWRNALAHHLDGTQGIGVYPYWHGHVRWGCVDFDVGEDESLAHALNLHAVLHEVEVIGWVERSRRKGYHLWVFSPAWQPARLMRRALLAACQIMEAPAGEVNPKSEHLDDDQIGNFVRLPYKGGAIHRVLERQVMVTNDGRPIPLTTFVDNCEPDAVEEKLRYLAEAYLDPNPPVVERFVPPPRTPGVAPSSRSDRMRQRGPRLDQDRSGWLFALALAMGEEGHTYEEIFNAVGQADEEHGRKYADRRDAEQRYADLARKALRREP